MQVQFVRFDDDMEKVVKAIEESFLPDEYADMLGRGCFTCR